MLEAKLIVVGGDAKASEVVLRLPTVIGRGREASLTLPHPLVSRRHTEIFEREGRLVVRDLGSLNGTFVNNQRIESEQVLEPDQLLTLGNVTFRASYQTNAVVESGDALSSPTPAVEVESHIKTRATAETEPAPATDEKSSRRTTVDAASQKKKPAESVRATEARGSSSADLAADPAASDRFALIESAQQGSPAESIAVDQLQGLPSAAAAVSFAGDFGLETTASSVDDTDGPGSMLDPADFQFDAAEESAIDPGQSSLGSFLRKLPR